METILSNAWLIFAGCSLTIICVLILIIIDRNDKLSQIRDALERLKRSFNDLDEQAKLIVKTDLELNKAQEELDKRLNSLDALQKTSRLISTTLEESEIFRRLDQSLISALGFEKILILMYDSHQNLISKVNFGFTNENLQELSSSLKADAGLIESLKQGKPFSSITYANQKNQTIGKIFNVEHFIITPIITQTGMIGAAFVGNISNASAVTEGDQELVSILANQIGQALENARLFEQIFKSTLDLESKVQERTYQLESALNKVKKISQVKSEFISAVSHELRTPLTSIKGYASILMDGKLGEIPEAVCERLKKINIHSDKLVSLINDLLDIARIESGRVEMNYIRCHIQKIIENVHDLLTPQMRDKNIQWVTQIDPHTPDVEADSSQIERVIINLVGNAIKFIPDNGSITVGTEFRNGFLTVEIRDTGIGVSVEDIPKLFDEFYRVENKINENVKGTGLGLPLAKKIIEAHKGEIWAKSEINQGTSFFFKLPVHRTATK